MTFADSYARELQLPPSVLQRATVTTLGLICRYAHTDDAATMLAAMPDLKELHQNNGATEATRPGRLTRLRRLVQRATHSARSTRQALQATGLGNDDVAFISALKVYFTQHLGEQLAQRLLHAVPGLESMTSWPLTPFREEQVPPTMR